MRSTLNTIVTFVVLASPAVGHAVARGQPAEQSQGSPGTPTGAPASASPADGDAAARHAKLTACLKEAKAKKLVGARKSAFIKDCVAAH